MTDHPSRAHADADPIRSKFATARRDLSAALIDRDDEIASTLSAVSGG